MQETIILLTYKQVCERVRLGRVAIARLVQSGDFPQPIYVSTHAPRFDEAEVNAWIAARKAQRGTKAYREHRKQRSRAMTETVNARWSR